MESGLKTTNLSKEVRQVIIDYYYSKVTPHSTAEKMEKGGRTRVPQPGRAKASRRGECVSSILGFRDYNCTGYYTLLCLHWKKIPNSLLIRNTSFSSSMFYKTRKDFTVNVTGRNQFLKVEMTTEVQFPMGTDYSEEKEKLHIREIWVHERKFSFSTCIWFLENSIPFFMKVFFRVLLKYLKSE